MPVDLERGSDAGRPRLGRTGGGGVVRIRKGVGYWLNKDGIWVSKDKGATWTKEGSPVEATIGPLFDLKDDKHMAAGGAKGIFETSDGGATWNPVAPLPEKFSMPKPGWYATLDWDPVRGVYYASQMGMGTFKLEAGK